MEKVSTLGAKIRIARYIVALALAAVVASLVINYLFSFWLMSSPSAQDTSHALRILHESNDAKSEVCSRAQKEFPDISDKKTTLCVLYSPFAKPSKTLQIIHGKLWSLVFRGRTEMSGSDWLGGSCIRYLGHGWWLRHQANLEDGSGWRTPLKQLCPFGLHYIGVG